MASDPQAGRLALYPEVISRLMLEMARARHVDRALLRCLEALSQSLGFSASMVCALHDDGDRLTPLAADGVARDVLKKQRPQRGEGVTGAAVAALKPRVVHAQQGTTLDPVLDPLAKGATSIAAVPLLLYGEGIGSLTVTLAEGHLEEGEETQLLAIGTLLAQHLYGARLRTELRLKELSWNDLLDSLPLGAAQFDARGVLKTWNAKMATLLGIPGSQTIGRAVWDILPPELAELARYLTQKAGARRQTAWDVVKPQAGSALPPLKALVLPLDTAPEEQADPTGFLLLLLEAHMPGAGTGSGNGGQPSDSTLSREQQFLSVIQHELRTPITSIKGAMHLLMDAPPDTMMGDHAALLSIVNKNARRLTHLIGDMLDVVAISNNELTLLCSRTELADVLSGVSRDMEAISRQYSVSLEIDPGKERYEVWGDISRLQQIFRHLIDNALKFSSRGSSVEVKVMPAEHSSVVIEVNDSGPGIPREFRERAFEMFTQQADHLTRARGGNGVGLYIARALTRLHGGQLSIVSTGAEGTRMRVELPLCPVGLSGVMPGLLPGGASIV